MIAFHKACIIKHYKRSYDRRYFLVALLVLCVRACVCGVPVVRLHAYTLVSQHILYAACLRLPSHFSKSFTVNYVDYMLHRIAYTVMMNCKGLWRARSWCNRAISRNLSDRTRKNLDNQESLCTCWYSNHDIFEERSRSNTLLHLSFNPADTRCCIVCTVEMASLCNLRINL
jgi:hypothetical protein